jgi:hypothetical protein
MVNESVQFLLPGMQKQLEISLFNTAADKTLLT